MASPTAAALIDVVDDRDQKIGTVSRGEVLSRGENFRTAHVFVLGRRGDLLLQRLAPGRLRHPGRWGSSVAAYLFSGEDYLGAAKRRLQEELGLDVPLHQIGKIEMRDEQSLKFVSLFIAHADIVDNEEPDHISELKFWSVGTLMEAIQEEPENFTPTFVNLFREFGDGLE